jgi:hypothetical protein
MWLKVARKSATMLLVILMLSGVSLGGCARLPYTTKVVHEDQRVAVFLQQEVTPVASTTRVQLTSEQIAAILRGFSLREKHRLPLRWFAEEAPPQKLFREDELQVLTPQLVAALQQIGPAERIYFKVFAPGMNPAYGRNVTGGWVVIHDRLFDLTVDYFHVQQPVKTTDPYDPNYPTPWTSPKTYLLFFEPGRFYRTDPTSDARGVDFREFLKISPVP